MWEVTTEAGFMACYRATFREVYAYAGVLAGSNRSAAEDVVQDVYTAVLRKARNGEVTSLSIGYFITAVRRRWIDMWRSSGREERNLQLVAAPAANTTSPMEHASEAGLPTTMLQSLTDSERAAVVLRYVDDMTVAEVAQHLGVSTRAAESTLSRALARLRRGDLRHA